MPMNYARAARLRATSSSSMSIGITYAMLPYQWSESSS